MRQVAAAGELTLQLCQATGPARHLLQALGHLHAHLKAAPPPC
jgi:hypothetical protein